MKKRQHLSLRESAKLDWERKQQKQRQDRINEREANRQQVLNLAKGVSGRIAIATVRGLNITVNKAAMPDDQKAAFARSVLEFQGKVVEVGVEHILYAPLKADPAMEAAARQAAKDGNYKTTAEVVADLRRAS